MTYDLWVRVEVMIPVSVEADSEAEAIAEAQVAWRLRDADPFTADVQAVLLEREPGILTEATP